MTSGDNHFNDFPKTVPTGEITTKIEKTFLVFTSVAVGLFLERAQCCSINNALLDPALPVLLLLYNASYLIADTCSLALIISAWAFETSGSRFSKPLKKILGNDRTYEDLTHKLRKTYEKVTTNLGKS